VNTVSQLRQLYRLSVYVGNADIHRHRPISGQILGRANRAGLRGACSLQGIEGFGHSAKIHDRPVWRLVDRTPITVHIIDTEERIRAFLPQLTDFAGSCLIVFDRVEVVTFGRSETPHRP
jgi:PII-like signaling protein